MLNAESTPGILNDLRLGGEHPEYQCVGTVSSFGDWVIRMVGACRMDGKYQIFRFYRGFLFVSLRAENDRLFKLQSDLTMGQNRDWFIEFLDLLNGLTDGIQRYASNVKLVPVVHVGNENLARSRSQSIVSCD